MTEAPLVHNPYACDREQSKLWIGLMLLSPLLACFWGLEAFFPVAAASLLGSILRSVGRSFCTQVHVGEITAETSPRAGFRLPAPPGTGAAVREQDGATVVPASTPTSDVQLLSAGIGSLAKAPAPASIGGGVFGLQLRPHNTYHLGHVFST